MSTLLILDFDGTMTDAEQEGAPFREGYLEDLATLTGASVDEIRARAAALEEDVAANPDAHGWMYGGRIVAPAIVDPYLRIMPVARRIFDAFGTFPGEEDRTRLLDGILYKYNYTKTVMAFRAGAAETLRALSGQPVYIVTNSHTEPVQRKIQALGEKPGGGNDLGWLLSHVYGRAKKYVLDEQFDAVPSELELPGLSRPVLLRRRHYFEVLDALRAAHDLSWGDVLVVGDIFELDLSLPLALGARVGLVVNAFTPEYEKRFISGHPRGRLIHALAEIPGILEGR